jgi:mannose-6-phosphate isomerase
VVCVGVGVQGAPEILRGEAVDACTKHYCPPFDEFALDVVSVPAAAAHTLAANAGPALILVDRGEGDATAELPAALAAVRALAG